MLIPSRLVSLLLLQWHQAELHSVTALLAALPSEYLPTLKPAEHFTLLQHGTCRGSCQSTFLQDSSSFIAGERSALLRAFRETLPSQQAIGSLYHAVHQITGRMDQEACDVRKVGCCCLGGRLSATAPGTASCSDTCPAVTAVAASQGQRWGRQFLGHSWGLDEVDSGALLMFCCGGGRDCRAGAVLGPGHLL